MSSRHEGSRGERAARTAHDLGHLMGLHDRSEADVDLNADEIIPVRDSSYAH